MRNTVLRSYHESLITGANEAIKVGVEPYAIAIALRSIASQLDVLAKQYEMAEASQEQKVGENNETELEGTPEE